MSDREVVARHVDGDRFEVAVRGHVFTVDQPAPDGGDEGPTPVEVFVAGLAACVGVLARRYLARHDLPVAGLSVSAGYSTQVRPSRVSSITVTITPPPGLTPHRLRGLLAVASHCTVHNSLTTPPEITLAVETVPGVQARPRTPSQRLAS
jgi:uncharacterized OsmC-like protein